MTLQYPKLGGQDGASKTNPVAKNICGMNRVYERVKQLYIHINATGTRLTNRDNAKALQVNSIT